MTKPTKAQRKTTAPAGPPLARLFAMAYNSLIDALHVELAARGHKDVRPSFGCVLLAVRQAPATSKHITGLLGVSKQATSKILELMEGTGYVRRETDPEDARASLVSLTRKGETLLETVDQIYRHLESRWAKILSPGRLEALRSDLQKVLKHENRGHLPPVRRRE